MFLVFAILRSRLRWLLPYGHWDTRGVIMPDTDTSFRAGTNPSIPSPVSTVVENPTFSMPSALSLVLRI